jgi:hypothetical protein
MKTPNDDPKRQYAMVKTKHKRRPMSPKQQPPAKKAEVPPVKVVQFPGTEALQKAVTDPMLHHLAGRLMSVMKRNGAESITDSEQGFGFHAFAGLEPKNAAEVLLATSMVATFEVGMTMITRAKLADNVVTMQEAGNLAAKLLGLFERQFATLTKARKPPQVVTVEHVHKHLHVTQPPGPVGDVIQSEDQAHATTDPRALATAPSLALPGQDTAKDALPIASDETRPLPDARRRARDRSPKR